MKAFTVIIMGTAPWRHETVNVMADYFRVLDGDLYFRNSVRGTYPQTVRVFARGHWCEVLEVQ